MGDPVGALIHTRNALAPDGSVMLVEPAAGDSVEENLNPIGRVFYAASTLICTPASQSQDVGLALGAQAGPARLIDVAQQAGFTSARVAARTPFNIVLELRQRRNGNPGSAERPIERRHTHCRSLAERRRSPISR